MSELKTADEWSKLYGVVVRDPDGWRVEDAPSWETPITEDDFSSRMARSTVQIIDPYAFLKHVR
jgi:hypothetical protein